MSTFMSPVLCQRRERRPRAKISTRSADASQDKKINIIDTPGHGAPHPPARDPPVNAFAPAHHQHARTASPAARPQPTSAVRWSAC